MICLNLENVAAKPLLYQANDSSRTSLVDFAAQASEARHQPAVVRKLTVYFHILFTLERSRTKEIDPR